MEALIYGVLTASATAAGGVWVASRPAAWLTERRLSLMVAAGGGILLATLVFEMLPEALEAGGANAFAWLFLGLATVVGFEHYLAPRLDGLFQAADDHGHDHGHACGHDHGHHHHHHAHALISQSAACSAVGCLLVCTFFDGLALAAGFGSSLRLGLLLSAGLLLHLLPEGIVAATVLLAAGGSAGLARRAAVAVGIALVAGVVAAIGLGHAAGTLAAALPFACGVIAYVVLGELLPVALRSRAGFPLFFGVAALFGAIERLIPHAHS